MNPVRSHLLGLTYLLPAALLATAVVLLSHTSATASPDPATATCGVVNLSSTSKADASTDFNCFNAAFQSCNAASLTAQGREGDVDVTWNFATAKSSTGCSIAETVARTTAGVKTTDAYVCTGLSNEGDGLHVNGCAAKDDVAVKPGDRFSQVIQPLTQENSRSS
jgi:hypothetical protein